MRFFDPLTEFNVLRREIDRAFGGFRGAQPPARRAFPLVNVRETDDAILVEALAAGLDPESIQVSVLRNELTVTGVKPSPTGDAKPEEVHRNERGSGKFTRTFTLPTEIDAERVTAEYRNGILTLTLPKAEAAKPRRIAVAVA